MAVSISYYITDTQGHHLHREDANYSMETKLLTTEQLAQVLQVSARHIRRLTQANRIPSIQVSERVVRYHVSSVINALNAAGPWPPPVGTKDNTIQPDASHPSKVLCSKE